MVLMASYPRTCPREGPPPPQGSCKTARAALQAATTSVAMYEPSHEIAILRMHGLQEALRALHAKATICWSRRLLLRLITCGLSALVFLEGRDTKEPGM